MMLISHQGETQKTLTKNARYWRNFLGALEERNWEGKWRQGMNAPGGCNQHQNHIFWRFGKKNAVSSWTSWKGFFWPNIKKNCREGRPADPGMSHLSKILRIMPHIHQSIHRPSCPQHIFHQILQHLGFLPFGAQAGTRSDTSTGGTLLPKDQRYTSGNHTIVYPKTSRNSKTRNSPEYLVSI